ncbi:hypothetical protein OG21DRAFT_1488353 [Imleria badia]|nr:hypothetical protein OG21DRAFT_1488353 [Imleria badia]
MSLPESEKYGKHWFAGDLLQMFAPSDDVIEAVQSWLLASAVESDYIRLNSNKGWIKAKEGANGLDGAYYYRPSCGLRHSERTPDAEVGPRTSGQFKAALPTNRSTYDEYIMLDCLHALYELEYTRSATELNSYGIVEYTLSHSLRKIAQNKRNYGFTKGILVISSLLLGCRSMMRPVWRKSQKVPTVTRSALVEGTFCGWGGM